MVLEVTVLDIIRGALVPVVLEDRVLVDAEEVVLVG